MARIAIGGGFADQGDSFLGSGSLLFVMIVISLSIISMVIFACGDKNYPNVRGRKTKPPPCAPGCVGG